MKVSHTFILKETKRSIKNTLLTHFFHKLMKTKVNQFHLQESKNLY